jgi:hypothetical protein
MFAGCVYRSLVDTDYRPNDLANKATLYSEALAFCGQYDCLAFLVYFGGS